MCFGSSALVSHEPKHITALETSKYNPGLRQRVLPRRDQEPHNAPTSSTGYNYGSISSLVLTTDKSALPRRDNLKEPDDAHISLYVARPIVRPSFNTTAMSNDVDLQYPIYYFMTSATATRDETTRTAATTPP